VPIPARRPVTSLTLIGGAPCLDFANTVDPRRADTREEFLDGYGALVEWAVHAGLESSARGERLARLGEQRPAQAARVLARAVSLREAVYALLSPRAPRHGQDDALAVLNEELARAWACAAVVRTGDAYELRLADEQALDRPLWPVALSAYELLTTPGTRVKECDDDECGWLFVDTSKAGRRRWCRMASCGNRAKLRRYRRRHSDSPSPGITH
jgi:predicted RNA-binding Zn ribbon-like protein